MRPLCYGYADVASKRPVDSDTAFYVADNKALEALPKIASRSRVGFRLDTQVHR